MGLEEDPNIRRGGKQRAPGSASRSERGTTPGRDAQRMGVARGYTTGNPHRSTIPCSPADKTVTAGDGPQPAPFQEPMT